MATWLYLRLEYARPAGFGPFRASVLQAIETCGSITAAGSELGLTYRQTWNAVKEINRQFGDVIIVKRGRHGGGASITPAASELLRRYRDVERRFYKIFADDLKAMEQLVGEDPTAPPLVPPWYNGPLAKHVKSSTPAANPRRPSAKKPKRANRIAPQR